jgi:hypothetical protein
METMLAMCSHLLRSKRVRPLMTGLAFAIFVASSGNAADLSRRNARHSSAQFERFVADRRQIPAAAEARKKLFDEFILWRAARDRR